TAVNGVATFTDLALNAAGTITLQFSSGALTPDTSANVVVSPAAASQLVIETQPSATATAGVAFSQQPAVRIEDALGNLLTADSTTVVTASIASGGGNLQGTLTATALNGVATFTG